MLTTNWHISSKCLLNMIILLQMPCSITSIFFCSPLLPTFNFHVEIMIQSNFFSLQLIEFLYVHSLNRSFWWPSMEPKSRPGLPGNRMQHMILVNNDFVSLLSFQQRGHNLIIITTLLYSNNQ